MEVLFALSVGILFAGGVYLLLRRHLVKLLIGLGLLSNAANLLIFAAARPVRGRPPIVPAGEATVVGPCSDPVPQALVLTAIVIGFALLAFLAVLLMRLNATARSADLDAMKSTE